MDNRNLNYEIAIIGSYPNAYNVRDGMMQRIKNIDGVFINKRRIYLDLSLRKYFRAEYSEQNGELAIFRMNYFFSIFKVLKELRHVKVIYIHSIYNLERILIPLMILSKMNNKAMRLILDFHGIVPEELKYVHKLLASGVMSSVEKAFFSTLSRKFECSAVFVTKKMQEFYQKKYSHEFVNLKASVIYPILPKNGLRELVEKDQVMIKELRAKLSIEESDIVVGYSGNLQKWQNIDLMLRYIAECSSQHNVKFLILTGHVSAFMRWLENYEAIPRNRIKILSVEPQHLWLYYSVMNYGFVLRDNIDVNQVANPTKLVEYLFYGIVPIVLSPKIGDYDELGYDYIIAEDLCRRKLTPAKSAKNQHIIAKMIQDVEVARIELMTLCQC